VRNLPARLAEIIAPRRLGGGFRWLLAATIVDNFGDGVVLSAGPLLVASLTRDPFLVSLALLFNYLPALLFAVLGGVAADRFDRRLMVVAANLMRAVVLAVLGAAIVAGGISIVLVLAAMFLLGTAETFADSASSTLLPSMVASEDLGIGNARKQGAFLLTNQLVAPPIGAFLFAVGMALPFAANAAAFVLGAVLIWRIGAAAGAVDRAARGAGAFRADLVEGLRWLVGHSAMRTLALTITAFNVTWGAAWGVLVLYASDRLGMGPVGFGLLTTAVAVGGLAGTLSYGALERRFSLGNIMRVVLTIETGWHLTLALTTSPEVALAAMVMFGAEAFVWGTTATVVRQRAVPNELLGRVGGVYQLGFVGGLVIGTPLGGVLASSFGITAPFWFGFSGSAILVLVLWRQFPQIAHSQPTPASPEE
jgi:predicted MFS family arabinose efflux permease